MLKKLFIGLAILVCTLALVSGGIFFWIRSMLPASEERLAFGNDQIIQTIDQQLQDVDIAEVNEKAPLMRQKSIREIQASIEKKEYTYEQLVAYYLLNIKEDQAELGNNAVSEVNPNAIAEARQYDQTDDILSLKGMPILVKENINTNDMPTSAGAYGLKDFIPSENAPVITELKRHGAIILGKTNLSEMSNWMSQKNPSGYSAKKGQTHNPFAPLEISPLGSSSGSAVAMATDLAAASLGTETVGSIISPATVNSTVGFKPSRDAIRAEKVIPITNRLDTVGVISKTVEDAYLTYQASATEQMEIDLDTNALKGKRIGILSEEKTAFGKSMKEQLKSLGAIPVFLGSLDTSAIDVEFLLKNDFQRDLNAYLQENKAPISSLSELIEYNKKDPAVRMRYGQSYLESSLTFTEKDEQMAEGIVTLAQDTLGSLMNDKQLDAFVFLGGNDVTLPAVAGAPELTVPFGKKGKEPIGATFVTRVGEDNELIKLAYSFEQATRMRLLPK